MIAKDPLYGVFYNADLGTKDGQLTFSEYIDVAKKVDEHST